MISDASIYVGTYKKYNEGSLFGKWMRLEDYADAEDFFDACRELHKDEEDPEFMFQDYEEFPERFYSESMCEDELQELYDFLEMYNEREIEIIEEYWDDEDASADASDIKDAYCGEFGSGEDYARQYACECMNIPDSLERYFDYNRLWEDLEGDGYVITTNGYVFMPL